MLLGSRTISDEFFALNGNAISRPDISCEPCLPVISALPPASGPSIYAGIFISVPSASPAGTIDAPTASIISFAPRKGLLSNVFSPLINTVPLHNSAARGIIILVSNPDSPVCSREIPSSFLPNSNAPEWAAIPVIVNSFPFLSTFAPIASATAIADSLSPQGSYPERWEVPSAIAAAIIALWAKLFEQGISIVALQNRKSPYSLLHIISAVHWPGAAASFSLRLA